MINNLICTTDKTLIQVMQIINENAKGICFVVDKFNSLNGVVTDGDIRRALLNDVKLDEKIESILSKEFIYGKIDED